MVKGFLPIHFPSQVYGGYCEVKQPRNSYRSTINTRDYMKLHIIHMSVGQLLEKGYSIEMKDNEMEIFM